MTIEAFEAYPVILQPGEHRKRAEAFWKMQEQGLDKVVFYDTERPHIALWIENCGQEGGAWTIPIYTFTDDHKEELCAVAWLNGFMGRSAFVHFCIFREYQKHSIHIGKRLLSAVFDTGYFDSLCGVTPVRYRHALHYIKQLGFTLGHMAAKGACYIARKKRHDAAIFSVLNKEDFFAHNAHIRCGQEES